MQEFIIDFTYQGTKYSGLATPNPQGGQNGYSVRLESGNQEYRLNIFAKPCDDDKNEWCFVDINDEGKQDKEFLQEVGEAIEKYETSQPGL